LIALPAYNCCIKKARLDESFYGLVLPLTTFRLLWAGVEADVVAVALWNNTGEYFLGASAPGKIIDSPCFPFLNNSFYINRLESC
jgi:hypothetical protein